VTGRRSDRLRAVGWLLTPLVVWAASFVGAWLGAVAVRGLTHGVDGSVAMVGGALVATTCALAGWWRLLRRAPAPRPTDLQTRAFEEREPPHHA
jgi:hypothetical protein